MLFGIFALIVSGMSWVLVGAVMGAAPKKNVSAAAVQLYGALVAILVGVILLLVLPGSTHPLEIIKNGNWFLAAYLVSGFTNCIGMSLMSDAMQKGPNGIVWTIIQSAMIYPFAIGIIFFDVPSSLIRYSGMAVILTALLLFGLGKENKVSTSTSGNWKLPAFLGWLVIGVQQNMHVLPSYFEAGRAISPIARAIFTSAGIMACALLMMCFIRQQRAPVRESFANKYFWIFVFGLQSVGLTVTYLLQFPGIDIMAKHDLGNASYPVMVSSCLIAFFMYSTIFLREKVRPISVAALLCCLAGIVMICL